MFLLDSDVARKICQYQLLNELAGALECSLEDFAILPQLRYQLRLSNQVKALKKLGCPESVELARSLINAASEVEVSADAANLMLQLDRPDIDTGEATLFAALHGSEESELLSGDKKAYIALSRVEDLPTVDTLWARLISLEEALLLLIQRCSFAIISNKIRSRPEVDIAVSCCFGRQCALTHEDVCAALLEYMISLRSETQGKYQIPDQLRTRRL